MIITTVKTVCLQEIKIKKPEKVNGKHYSVVEYGDTGRPLFIQTPAVFLNEEGIFFDKEDNSELYIFLRNFQEYLVQHIHANSLEFFNKVFSLDHIYEALGDIFKTFDTDFFVKLSNTESINNKNMTYCKAILKFDKVYFDKASIKVNISLEKYRAVLLRPARNNEFLLEEPEVTVSDPTLLNFFD